MSTYIVTGPRKIAGRTKGARVELTDDQAAPLVAAGHVRAVPVRKPKDK